MALNNGGLVHEDILVGVVAVDEAVAVAHVEPLHLARHLLGQNLAFDLKAFSSRIIDK